MILAGDIGGTSTRLGLFRAEGESPQLIVEQTSPSQCYESLDDIVCKFISTNRVQVSQACFGVAGPILNGMVQTPNLPWVVEARSLAEKLGLKWVTLLNDLEANAHGIAALKPAEFVTLSEGHPNATGNAAVISAGTGLGEAGLYWDGKAHHPFACEGGHADFAPNNELEMELLKYLQMKFGHVSWERVLSGPGLHNIYRFLCDTGRVIGTSHSADEVLHADSPSAVSKAALERSCPRCAAALDLFVSIYGAAAGNLALKMMARGGIYLGGGIAPKIINKLKEPIFMAAFTAKGRMRPLMESIPVRVVMNDEAALLGAARFAWQSLQVFTCPTDRFVAALPANSARTQAERESTLSS